MVCINREEEIERGNRKRQNKICNKWERGRQDGAWAKEERLKNTPPQKKEQGRD